MKSGGRIVWVGNPLSIILVLYIVSAFSSFFVKEKYLSGFDFDSYEAWHYLAYTFFVALSLAPVVLLKGAFFNIVDVRIDFPVKAFYAISSVGIWYSLFYQVPYALTALALGAADVRESLNVAKETILPPTIETTIAVVVSSFYVVFIYMFFFAVARRMSWYYKLSMFVGGLLYVVSSICFTARDGALFYGITMVYCYGIFLRYLDKNVRSWMSKIIVLAAILILGFFVSFTLDRFYAYGDFDELVSGTVGYIGQQPYVFAETIVSQTRFYGFDLRVPLISLVTTGVEQEVIRDQPYEWSFGTFLKDYYSMYGWWSLVLISVVQFAFFYTLFSKRDRMHPVVVALVVGFYFQFMLSGVFYFRLGTRGGNLYMVLYFIFCILVAFGVKVGKGKSRALRAS